MRVKTTKILKKTKKVLARQKKKKNKPGLTWQKKNQDTKKIEKIIKNKKVRIQTKKS